jgi:hypothetical protein
VVASDSFGWADEIPKLIRAADAAVEPELVDVAPHGTAGAAEVTWPRWGTGLVRRTA